MEFELRHLIWILIVNTLVVLAYWIWNHFREKGKRGGYRLRCITMLLCPIVGVCYFFFGWLYFRLFFREPVDLDDVIFSKDRVKTNLKADENAERNFVPLEEAIAVTDKDNTRFLMMEVVRRDISNSLTTIALALRSEDSEVSHYAASVLSETLGVFRVNVQKLYQHVTELEKDVAAHDREHSPVRTPAGMRAARATGKEVPKESEKEADREIVVDEEEEETPRDFSDAVREAEKPGEYAEFYREEDIRERTLREAYKQGLIARDGIPDEESASVEQKLEEEIGDARELMDSLYRVLRQKVFSALEQQTYSDMMEEMAELIDRRDVLQPYELESIALQRMDAGDYSTSEKWCERSLELYPQSLVGYTCKLKLYFSTDDQTSFFNTLNALKQSNITLDHETLEMVRVFL